MPKKIRITPWRPGGRRVYCATFNDATGKRVTRSLATEDASAALLICAGLARLAGSKVASPDNAPRDVADSVVSLFCGRPRPVAIPIRRSPDVGADLLKNPAREPELLEKILDLERLLDRNERTDGRNRREARAQKEDVPDSDVVREVSDKAAPEIAIVALRFPRSGITGPKQGDPVP